MLATFRCETLHLHSSYRGCKLGAFRFALASALNFNIPLHDGLPMATVPRSISTAQMPLPFPSEWTLADVQTLLGDIPLYRIAIQPALGSATESDVERRRSSDGKLFELEYKILVEKTMGWYESIIGILVAHAVTTYLDQHDLGQVLGADGLIKILPGIVKIPDLCFISWDRFPSERLARTPIPTLVPNLVVEMLSESNTADEMHKKLHRYFEAGVQLVWYIDPATRSAISYSSPSDAVRVVPTECITAGAVLPGFSINLEELFDRADQQAAKTKP